MAHLKKQNSPLDLCKRITALGDTISIRMLEYLSASKHPVHGFQTLAVDFLDLSRLIWTIDAGLKDAAAKNTAIPPIITLELGERFAQVHDEFTMVSSMISRLIENDHKKGGFGKAFRTMFTGTDVDKVRHTLEKSRDHLRMGSAMFQWTSGAAQTDSSMGIGYAELAASLQRMNLLPKDREKDLQPATISDGSVQPVPRVQALASHLGRPSKIQQSHEPQEIEHGSHTISTPMRSPSQKFPVRPIRKESHAVSQDAPNLNEKWQAPTEWGRIHGRQGPGYQVRSAIINHQTHEDYQTESTHLDNSSEESIRSRTHTNSHETLAPSHQYTYSQIESVPEQRLPHKYPATVMTAGGQSGLVDAVQFQRQKALEQLLHGGNVADPKTEAGLFKTAIQNRDMESIELLLSSGGNVNGADKDGYTPLYTATECCDIEAARLLLELNADTNLSASPLKISPLCLAASKGRTDFVELFVGHGGDVNYTMENGNTTLIYSMEHGASVEVVRVLARDADVNFKNNEGATALFQSILANRIDLLEVLLDNGANPNLPAPKHPLWPSTYKPKALQLMLARGADVKKTPGIMELASSLKNLESIKILMNASVSPNIRKDGVYTPLCSAIRDNSKDIVTYLLANGADPNLNAVEYPAFKCITHNRPHFLPQLVAAGVDLRSPKGIIECAVAHKNKVALTYLLKQDVCLNDRSSEGNTALTTAIREDRIDIVELLLEHGADPAVRGADWPICMAIKRPDILKKLLEKTTNPRSFRGVVEMAVVADQLQSIKLLLAAGVCVEDKNCGVFSPLTTSIRERNKQIVRYLLDEAKADPNAPGEHLPIVKALRRLLPGDTEILQLLLARGADINKMHRGYNAVLQAIENGDAEILRLLMEQGGPVDLTLTDEVGKTVLETLQERGWEEGMAMLCPEVHQPE